MKSYKKLEKSFKEIADIGGALSVLYWDNAAMMPSGGAQERAEQIATLSSIIHKKITSNQIKDFIDDAKNDASNLDDWQQSNLQLMEREYLHANAVDNKLVEELSIASSECEEIWRKARAENDFKTYLPYQQKVLELSREIAQSKGDWFNCSPYDAMLDQFDSGRCSSDIDIVFDELNNFLPDFISNVRDKQSKRDDIIPFSDKFPTNLQKNLGLRFMKDIGFDFNHGRLDISHHPFCGGTATDVRITTRYDEDDFTSAMMGVLHESGHALYEQNLPHKYRGQPVGQALGMSIHESQSLLIEMQLCRSKEFLQYAASIIQEELKNSSKSVEYNQLLMRSINVNAGAIRVDADEVTYPLHVILRYNLEKSLIEGDIQIADVPELWNQYMKDKLGVTIDDNDYYNGCMQDVHWTDGSFGYFPTYTLGAIHAAQFYNKAQKNINGLPDMIKNGQFKTLIDWLDDNIHSQASKYTASDLLQKVTGEKMNIEIYKSHLKDRYL